VNALLSWLSWLGIRDTLPPAEDVEQVSTRMRQRLGDALTRTQSETKRMQDELELLTDLQRTTAEGRKAMEGR